MTTEHRGDVGREKSLFRHIGLRASAEQRESIYNAVLGSSHVDVEYVALLTLAALIGLFGLLENSAAVIIGAMLISPLMNPILSSALALLLGDGNLGKRSATTLASSTAGVIGITWLVASLIPLKQATPEILARTAPNLLDLFIAFLSGLAGTLALRGGSVALTILPGVAIAVAVVPPLSVVGYGLSTHQGSIAGGAFLLFVTNLVSIIISAAAVFRVMGFQPHREAEQGRWKLKYRMGISAAVLLLLSIPLFLTLRKAAIQVRIRSEVQRDLNLAFQRNKASISDLSFSQVRDGLLIQATVQATQYIETSAVQSVEDTLRRRYGQGTKLQVDQILITQGGVTGATATRAQNPIGGGIVKPAEDKAAFDFKSSSLKSLEFIESQVDAVLSGTTIQRKAPPEIVLSSATPQILNLQLASPEPLSGQTISLLGSQVASKLGLPIQLRGQVELRGPSFQLTLTPATPNLGLGANDRVALAKVVQRAQDGSLRLRVTCPSNEKAAGATATPRVVSEIRQTLSRSPLKGSQWAIDTEPPVETSSSEAGGSAAASTGTILKAPPAIVASQMHCDLKSYQDF